MSGTGHAHVAAHDASPDDLDDVPEGGKMGFITMIREGACKQSSLLDFHNSQTGICRYRVRICGASHYQTTAGRVHGRGAWP